MLTELDIREFGLMEHVQLHFSSGMTVFTGETGAGKSILVNALSAAFGARTHADWVRHGAKAAELTAVIEDDHPALLELLTEQGLESSEPFILRRIVGKDGRSRAWLNGTPVPLKLLQQIGHLCLDIHAQHEHQSLMKDTTQRQWLDARVKSKLLENTATCFKQLKHAEQGLQSFLAEQGESQAQSNWMRSELTRLQGLNLQDGLHDTLSKEVEAGQHIAQIQHAGAQAAQLLDDGETTVRSLLSQVLHEIQCLSDYHDGLAESVTLLEQVDALLGEVSPHLQDAQEVALDMESLQEADHQLAILRESMSRHQCDEQGLIDLMEQWQQRLDHLDTAEWDESRLNKAFADAKSAYQQAATALHQARIKAGQQLQHDLRPYLDRLGMQGMRLDIQLHAQQDDYKAWQQYGWDMLDLLVSSNPGEPFRKLADVASGGELSRFALALKASGTFDLSPQTAVFDEVDVGVGGETAWCVGELLTRMGANKQVFVISHLPQVAACAQHQISILKAERDGRTITDLACLQEHERPAELARMLGGVNNESLEHAQQMFHKASSIQQGQMCLLK
ncbi:MAG: DNA repair protein RecN [Mariprofundaceae bacterium]|nr:DNA repair protein RecN [Mariprofundaceae bacterium]